MKREFHFEEEEPRSDVQFSREAAGRTRKRNERSELRRRPVGQEVKTGASHAPNVGSIPARVTTPNCPYDGEIPPAAFLRRAGDFQSKYHFTNQ